jgi:chromosome segregation ATPase
MSEAANIPDRVARLEDDMAEVRFLAEKAEHDASDCMTILRGHTGVLNAIRADQVDQGRKIVKLDGRIDRLDGRIDRLDGRIDRVETEMREGFADVRGEMREGFARVDAEARKNYSMLAQGQQRITDLLTKKPDEG